MINKNLPLHNVKTVKTKRKLSQENSAFLNQFNETQLEAAAKVRYYSQTIHKIGSDIDAIDPMTGKTFTKKKNQYDENGIKIKILLSDIKITDPARYNKSKAIQKRKDPSLTDEEIDAVKIDKEIPYSIFDPDQEISEYMMHKYIVEVTTEKRDILIPELAKTSHAKPNNNYPKMTGVLEGTSEGQKATGGKRKDYIEDLETGVPATISIPKRTIDQIYFKGLETKNLPHIGKDGQAEEWLGRYDSFDDIAIAALKKEGTIRL